MRRIDLRPGFHAPALLLALIGLVPNAALADASPPSYQYSVTGTGLNSTGVSGPNVISFVGTGPQGATLTPGAPFSLGQFAINTGLGLGSTTYNHADFNIELHLPQFNTTTPLGPVTPSNSYPGYSHQINQEVIHGHLDGTVNGSGQSNVVATIDSVKAGYGLDPVIPEDKYNYVFPFPDSDVKVPGTISLAAGAGQTHVAVSAEIVSSIGYPAPAPEPTTLALYAAALGGLAFWRRQRRRAVR